MKKTLAHSLSILGLTLVAGCDQGGVPDTTTRSNNTANNNTDNTPPKADNTARNKVDRDMDATKTPEDQSNASADVRITADIRKGIMNADNMSTNAENVKIITDKAGVVTLRGPVDTQAEKDAIEAIATSVAGVTRVVNELEVKTP